MSDILSKIIIAVITFIVTLIVTFSLTKYSVSSMPAQVVDRDTGCTFNLGKPLLRQGSYAFPIILGEGFGAYRVEQNARGRRIVIVTNVLKK